MLTLKLFYVLVIGISSSYQNTDTTNAAIVGEAASDYSVNDLCMHFVIDDHHIHTSTKRECPKYASNFLLDDIIEQTAISQNIEPAGCDNILAEKSIKSEVFWNTQCSEVYFVYIYNFKPLEQEVELILEHKVADGKSLILQFTSTIRYILNSNILLYLIMISLLTTFSPVFRQTVLKGFVDRGYLKTGLQNLIDFDKGMSMIAILNAMNVGIIVTDTNMTITFMNWTAGLMCECQPKTAVGKTMVDIIQSFFAEPDCKPYEEVYEKYLTEDSTSLKLYKDGRCLDIQHSKSPLVVEGTTIGTVILLQDMTASREQMKNLRYKASHDSLTGLPNRAAFEGSLRNLMSSANSKSQHVVGYLDLDRFKAVNDSAGHAAGDALLQQLAKLMTSEIRKTDFVARLGGDEFGLILYNCGFDQGKSLMEHLVKQINSYAFHWDQEVRYVGASVGITLVDSNRSNDEIVAQADKACYTAKRRGKGRVCFFE